MSEQFKPQKWRKKPVEVLAARTGFSYENDEAIMDWCGGKWDEDVIERRYLFSIPTLEGDMKVSAGDYVIQGVEGEFYPCKPDIFDKTYALVPEPVMRTGRIRQEECHCGDTCRPGHCMNVPA